MPNLMNVHQPKWYTDMITRLIQGAGNYKVHVPKDYGPGPSILLAGTGTLGYFGEMSMDGLVASASLSTLTGYFEGTVQSFDNAWLKCIDQGKVLYVAKTPLRIDTHGSSLHTRGMLLGSKQVTLLGRTFKVRVMTGGNADPAAVAGGEWSRIMYGLCNTRPVGAVALANFSENQLRMNGTLTGRASWCQEKAASNGNYLIRGHTGVQGFGGGSNIGANGSVFGWRPVLELIP